MFVLSHSLVKFVLGVAECVNDVEPWYVLRWGFICDLMDGNVVAWQVVPKILEHERHHIGLVDSISCVIAVLVTMTPSVYHHPSERRVFIYVKEQVSVHT